MQTYQIAKNRGLHLGEMKMDKNLRVNREKLRGKIQRLSGICAGVKKYIKLK